jgi:excisionase family DNA binding protein
VETSNQQTQARAETKAIETIKSKEFLTVRDAAILLNSSRQTIYNLIQSGALPAVNISVKKTLIRRSEIDQLFTVHLAPP